MRPIVRALVVAVALLGSSPTLAEELVVSDIRAFGAQMDAAAQRCEVAKVLSRITELAVISGTGPAQGDMFRMNRAQYGELLTVACASGRQWSSVRTNEKISIEDDQAIVTADVAETITLDGQQPTSRLRERATVELIDGKLMLTQLHVNLVN